MRTELVKEEMLADEEREEGTEASRTCDNNQRSIHFRRFSPGELGAEGDFKQ